MLLAFKARIQLHNDFKQTSIIMYNEMAIFKLYVTLRMYIQYLIFLESLDTRMTEYT